MTKERLNEILGAANVICGECNGTEDDCNKCFVRAICDDVLGRNKSKEDRSYCVTLLVTGYCTANVTATSEEEAIKIAQDMYRSSDNPKIETVGTSVWEVRRNYNA